MNQISIAANFILCYILSFKTVIIAKFGIFMSHYVAFPQPVKEVLPVIGALIKLARKEAGLSMTDLALRAGIERKTVARLEKGDASIGMGIFMTIIWLLDIPLFNGLDLGNRQSRKKFSILLNSLSETQPQRKKRRNIDDNF